MSPLAPDWDLVVVGGGAGGMAAARAGAARRVRTLLVQEGPIGGDCTFTGCVPSKAVIAAAAEGARFADAMRRAREAIDRIAATEDDAVFRAAGVEVVHARAAFRGARELAVDGATVRAPRIVVATGAAPVVPPVPGLRELDPLTNETVFALTEAPASLVVLGGGAIGCELAQAMARLGVRVSLVEALPRLLAREEPEASAVVERALRADGVDLRLGVRAERAERTPGGARLHLSEGPPAEGVRILVAVGRRPVTEGLGLERAGVATDDRGNVVTDARLATTAEGVYAVGDVTGRLPFTHAADEMGRIAVGNALARRGRGGARFRAEAVPWVTFTDPEVARVGCAEAEAPRGARVAELGLAHVDRAIVSGRTDGFVKLIAAPRRPLGHLGGGRLAGATVVAERAGEMIHEAALAMRSGMFAGRLAQTVHAYPTWSVAMRQAAAQLVTEADGRRARPARRGA